MKKKIIVCFLTIFLIFILTVLVNASDFTFPSQGAYSEPVLLYSSKYPGAYEIYIPDLNDGTSIIPSYCYVFTSEYYDFLENNYSNYKNDNETFDSFDEYIKSKYGNGYIDSDISESIQKFENSKKTANGDSSSGDDNEGGSSGGSGSGESGGSDNGGASGGTPNITINGSYTEDMYGDCNCSGLCDCYKQGFDDGWYAFEKSDILKDALQQAFDQGFGYLTSSTYQKEISEAETNAVANYKSSEEYESTINNEREEAVNEYKESDEYKNAINNAKEESKSEFVDKIESILNGESEAEEGPESNMIEIIGQAQEGAKADLVVEVESALAGNTSASEGAASDMVSLVQTKVQEGINDFSSNMQDILEGESIPAEGTAEAELSASIEAKLDEKYQDANDNAVNNYKASIEYEKLINDTYTSGVEAGKLESTTQAAAEAFEKGKFEGYAEFQGTDQFQKALKSYYDSGYKQGYNKGLKSAPTTNPASVVIILLVAFGLLFAYFSIKKVIKKIKK